MKEALRLPLEEPVCDERANLEVNSNLKLDLLLMQAVTCGASKLR